MGAVIKLAVGGLLAVGLGFHAEAQETFPDYILKHKTWSSGEHHINVFPGILCPGDPDQPVFITGSVDAELVSNSHIRLTPGFHAGNLANDGRFHAYINSSLADPNDVVVITPEPSTHITGNVLHVEKWEKLEIGVQLPQVYEDAIASFYAHYYTQGIASDATPLAVDPVHDLDPYADDSLQLVIILTSPTGIQHMKWGFYMKEAEWNSVDPTAELVEDLSSPLFPYHIRFRFAPDEEGAWQFGFSIKAPHTLTPDNDPLPDLHYSDYSFVCDPPQPNNHGYLQVNNTNRRTLRFEDGTAFYGLGTNLGGPYHINPPPGVQIPTNSEYFRLDEEDMRRSMEQLHGVGANFVRIFLFDRVYAPEYVNIGVYDYYHKTTECPGADNQTFDGNGQTQCWAFDKILDQARYNDVFIQLCINPYPPLIAYQNNGWNADPYWLEFVKPGPSGPMSNPYDMKRYFYLNGDPATANALGSAFYYWKRKYKYIMSRWGYSVNIATIEPFNETDQMLSYRDCDVTTNCGSVNSYWHADPDLPGVLNQWVTDLADFVRQPVDFAHPETSSLGESKLFLLSYTDLVPVANSNHYLPLINPKIDLIDLHRSPDAVDGVSTSFDLDQDCRETFESDGHGKPFHNGEYTTYGVIPLGPDGTVTEFYFDNYDVSFHNEIWASTFFGNFASGTSWEWSRVFWWPYAMRTPPDDFSNPFRVDPTHQFSNVLNVSNKIDLGIGSMHIEHDIKNRSVFHNFKALTEFLNNPNGQVSHLFDGVYTAHKVYDDNKHIECYYVVNADQNVAIGWVHNTNTYWRNHYYYNRAWQNYLGCVDPGPASTQILSLPAFAQSTNYQLTWFPTRMNMTELPDDASGNTGLEGAVTLDLSSMPLHGIVNTYYSDTLHSDYAFIIAPEAVHRMSIAHDADTSLLVSTWDFAMYPNPADKVLNLIVPDDVVMDIAIYDLTGRRVQSWSSVTGPSLRLPLDRLARGAYSVQVSNVEHSSVKELIIR